MTPNAVRSSLTVVTLLALAGCQSGPKWAFWKNDAVPDASAVARSAEPKLPSSQSTPTPVAIAGLTPAASPSSTNLAAAGTPAAPGALPNSPANALADKLTAPKAVAPAAVAAAAPPAGASVSSLTASPAAPAAGPYDPKGYKPATTLASVGTGAAAGAGEVDRYGMSSATPSPYQASAPAAISTSSPAPAGGDRYGAASAPATPIADAPLHLRLVIGTNLDWRCDIEQTHQAANRIVLIV